MGAVDGGDYPMNDGDDRAAIASNIFPMIQRQVHIFIDVTGQHIELPVDESCR